MLGVHRIGSDRALYYLSDLARELPLPTSARPGTWFGAGAAALGLDGAIDPAALQALLEGRHPRTDRPLGTGRATVAGLDLTFSAPKSASVLFALGGADTARRIVTAHDDAVSGALAYLERHAVGARRQAGEERLVLPTRGVVAGRFTHAVNRNHDPHLHSHVVMANLVHASDGRWGACDGRGLCAHSAAASAVYDAHLRHELTRTLGVRWSQAPGKSKEVEGVPAALLGEFSSRAADIRRQRHDAGVRSTRGGRIAWAVTRGGKELAPPFDVLVVEWRRRAACADRADLSQVLPPRRQPGRTSVDEHAFAAVLVTDGPRWGAPPRRRPGPGCGRSRRRPDQFDRPAGHAVGARDRVTRGRGDRAAAPARRRHAGRASVPSARTATAGAGGARGVARRRAGHRRVSPSLGSDAVARFLRSR